MGSVAGGYPLGWLPKKSALSLTILRASPAPIGLSPRRTRKVSGLAAWPPSGPLVGPRAPAPRVVPPRPLASMPDL
jgi:hypothetical protein